MDAGTQYSPDGYPPTAPAKYRRKRKDVSHHHSSYSPPDRSESMSAAATAGHRPDPLAGDSRRPSRAAPGSSSQASSSSRQPEPTATVQEARSTHGHSAAPKRSRPAPGSLKVMPLQYETCNPKDLGALVANMLMELIRINDQIPLRDGRLTRFHSRAPPGISVSDYLQRLIQHATLSPPILLSMVYYIDRLCSDYPNFTINSLTVHRFLITAGTVAAKGLSDSFWTNPTYARIGGIPVSELATLELEFLQKVNWRIVPKPEMLVDYYCSLVERTEGYVLEEQAASSSSELDESEDVEEEDESEEVEGSSTERASGTAPAAAAAPAESGETGARKSEDAVMEGAPT